jgi:phage terminase small subunit
MRGPPPIPTRLKLLRGNPGHQKLNRAEPQPPSAKKCPEPPEGLAGDAREAWLYQAPRLHRIGLLTEVDTIALEIYAVAFERRGRSPDLFQIPRRSL